MRVSPDFKPQLRHCTFFLPQASKETLMIVGQEHFSLEQEGSDLKSFLNLKRYLDGRHSVSEIAEITGVPLEDCLGVATSFEEQGLLRVEDPELERIPVSDFLKQIDASVGMWAEQIGYHRLWSGLENLDFRKEVFLGLILETYHYINSAARHIGTAVTHTTDEKWRHLLAEYLSEEYDHAWMARKSLVNMGVPEEQVLSAHPIIGTWSLANNLCEIARTDTLGYIACTKLFEARGTETLEGADQLEELAVKYGFPEGCLAPLASHVRADVEANHVGLLEEALEGRDYVDAASAHRAVNNLHDLKHSYDQWADGIVLYYSDIANYIPRLKVDYFSL